MTAILFLQPTSTLPTRSSEQRAPRRCARGARARFAPLAGLRLPAFTDAPSSPALSSAQHRTRPSPPRQARFHAQRHHARLAIAVKFDAPHPGYFAASCNVATSGVRACSSPMAALSTSATASHLASHRRIADVSRPVTERFALGPSGHSPPLLLFGPLPASDEGQGPKAAPEAE